MRKKKKNSVWQSLSFPVSFVSLLWIIRGFEFVSGIRLDEYGVLPRTESGLIGILTMPLIHANFAHLASNSLPLLVLGTGIFYFYRSVAARVWFLIYIMSGTLVWGLARESYHIGASGLVYGFIAFIFFSGLFRRDIKSIALALFVALFYGGAIWGILPLQNGVSWEGHLLGGLSGIFCAYIYRKADPPDKYDWEDETPGESDGLEEWRYAYMPDGSRILKR